MVFRKLLSEVLVLCCCALAAPAQQKAAQPTAPAKVQAARPTAPAAQPAAKPWNRLAYPKLGEVKLPEVKRYTLANGMKLFLVEDHRLPLVDARALVRTGSRWEPADKAGLAGIFGQVLRTGGTKTKTGDQMDEELEAIAASVESGVGTSSGSVGFSCLKGDEDKVLATFADVLMNPEFRQEKIDLAKTLTRTGISRRNDDVGDIASREFRKVLYGAASPYARQAEYFTVDPITRADLVAFHQQFYHPNNILLGLWGDFRSEEMKAKIEKVFAGWRPGKLELPPVPQADPPFAGSLNLIHKEDINQTNLRVGHLDGRYDDPDFFALSVMAEILCTGGFSSRITKHIRTQMGLAYAAGGRWGPDFDHRGTFGIRVDTKSETTAKAMEAVLKEIRGMREKEVSDEELRVAKESILNAFVFNFQSVGQIVDRLMTYEYYGYPADFLEKYKENVEKVTKAHVLAVAQKHLQPDKLVILAVGNDKDFDKPLNQIAHAGGKVNVIDIAIPETKPTAAAAAARPVDPAMVEKGRGILAAAQKFFGGLEKLRAIKDTESSAKASANTPQGTFELTLRTVLIFPSTLRNEVVLPFGAQTTFFDGSKGWSGPSGGIKEMSEAQIRNTRNDIFRNLFNLLRGEGNSLVQYDKREGDADVLLITQGDFSTRLFVDSAGRVLKQAYRGQTFAGVGDAELAYSDYRDVSGIQVPFKTVLTMNGQKLLEGENTEFKINIGADPAKLAQKPE